MTRSAAFALCLAACAPLEPAREMLTAQWSDGDSGHLIAPDGTRTAFRLADVDAPETRDAKCEAERAAGYAARDAVRALTAEGVAATGADPDPDRYGRSVLTLALPDGRDVASVGLAEGWLRPYRFEGTRRIDPKPDWCGR